MEHGGDGCPWEALARLLDRDPADLVGGDALHRRVLDHYDVRGLMEALIRRSHLLVDTTEKLQEASARALEYADKLLAWSQEQSELSRLKQRAEGGK